jgi:ketosteroid isomerase-like protein
MSQESVELVLRGYRAFLDADFEALEHLLAPAIAWYPVGARDGAFADRATAIDAIREAHSEGYRVELERCVGREDEVIVSFRAAREAPDASDDRPLQSRRTFTVARFSAVIAIESGQVSEVREYPHLAAALEAAGIDEHA